MNYSMVEIEATKNEISIEGAVEVLLFISSSPVPISRIASALDTTEAKIRKALENLKETYQKNRGLIIQQTSNKVQLVSNPILSEEIEKFLGIEVTTKLSQASMEALAIIAYKQPITRPEIDEIRGVNSDGVVRNLLSKGLLEEVGRLEVAGRPILYETTSDFLSFFGLASLKDLPAFETIPGEKPNENGILKD